ncbi:hypothetical protein CHS0354_004228 [Potamilus streckersoni]|uniref:Uncharacterized protein n=1 Tax=Potamilus streckersoni TaxID=2493646 RepID=A0AAE0RRC0_9BIVA|nr:hypothetical protein CHS0354_004228 [Potamilus streckersoni]
MASKPSLLVAAIDFGTTYSGWAFSFKHEYDTDPTRIIAKQWFGGPLVSMKAPTTVLIKPDGRTFDSFGYDAESKYSELASDDNNEHKRWYYFRRFKMMLHGKLGLDRNIDLEDETQKSLPAKTVFSLTIRYLKEDMLKNSKDKLSSGHLIEDEITWVLTVPAIWTDAAKQFMREAAIEAGIRTENLRIALEPETASIFCRLLPVEKMVEGGGITSLKPGSIYMVLDAGVIDLNASSIGGTIDITVHEVLSDGKLKELQKASGGAWGGTQVDEAYKQFLISLVGNPVFQRFQLEKKEDYLDMFRDFEVKKRDIVPDNDNKVTIRLPSSLREIFEDESGEDLRTAILQTRYANEMSFTGDKLRINASVIKRLFSNAIESTVSHVKELMKERTVHGLSSILMVGGFSESKMLQHAIRSNFPNVKVIIPHEAGLVVLKGAVVFGHVPSSVAQRVCKYTYGVGTTLPFDNENHDITKRIECEDGPRCDDIFDKYVEIGQTIALNEATKEKMYVPTTENQSSVGFSIYASTQKSPKYVTDNGCMKLGYVLINILDKSVPRDQRSFLFSMTFGGTEIEVAAKEKRTGNATKATVDFLG